MIFKSGHTRLIACILFDIGASCMCRYAVLSVVGMYHYHMFQEMTCEEDKNIGIVFFGIYLLHFC